MSLTSNCSGWGSLCLLLTICYDVHSFARECDGFISASSVAYDPESLEAMRIWLGETNRPVYAVGPLVPPGFGGTGQSERSKQMDVGSSHNGRDIQVFLDRTLKGCGKRSLIYAS